MCLIYFPSLFYHFPVSFKSLKLRKKPLLSLWENPVSVHILLELGLVYSLWISFFRFYHLNRHKHMEEKEKEVFVLGSNREGWILLLCLTRLHHYWALDNTTIVFTGFYRLLSGVLWWNKGSKIWHLSLIQALVDTKFYTTAWTSRGWLNPQTF